MAERVAIIGGGFAGLAAGVALTERGREVILLERRKHLGGRAYSFNDPKTGDVVDNGQHLFMGCYHHTISFLTKIGCLDRLRFQQSPRVEFLDEINGIETFECPSLPAPFHVLAGLMRMGGIGLRDKLRAINVGLAIRRKQNKNGAAETPQTVSAWLDGLRQSERIKQRFWYPIAIATLNESPEIASAKLMARVLREAFAGSRSDSSLGIARVGLSKLYTVGAQDYIESHGGQVRTDAAVAKLKVQAGRAISVELRDGERIEADYFITAVPHAALLQMLPDSLREGEFAPLALLETSPIVSINLWFDRPVIDREFLGLLGTNIQWLFNKDLLFSTGNKSNQIALVISAASGHVDWTKEALVEMALGELKRLVPESRNAKLLHSRVVKEREATLSHTIASDRIRPDARTSIPNLILAGDWTNTGLPATIEGAVMSGDTAAEIISSALSF